MKRISIEYFHVQINEQKKMAQDSTEIRKKLFRSPMVEGDRLAGTV